MKKVLSILVLVLATVQMAFAGDVITRDAKQLPLTARNFINQYFTKPQISHIKIETGILGSKSYEVLLTDRTEIDFDSNGNWTDVDCKKAAVPAALIPASVKEYVLKSATKLFSVLLASKRPLITELADKLRLKYPLLPTISPCPTMRLEAIRSIIPISCRRYPKSV